MSNSTRREAERIAADLGYHGGWQNQQALTDAIDAALQARDERAAKIVHDSSFGDPYKTVQRKLADVIMGDD